jgi:hypothetical protein
MRLYGRRHHGCRVDYFEWRRHQLIVMENELVRVGILASKGAEIIEFRYKPRDLDVLWHAPQPLMQGDYVPTRAREQGAFLDYYNGGWQEIFPSAGPATEIEGAQLGQHGEVALLPWDVSVGEDSAERVELEFSVETIRTPFRIERRMSLAAGSSVLRIDEEAQNLGEQALPYAWGHHPVLGPPFLAEGCRIEMPPCKVEGRQGVQPFDPAVPSKVARTEDVLVHSELTGNWCAVRNPALQLAAGVAWDTAVLPYLWMWRVYGGSWGYPYFGREYCLGIEPFNCPPPQPKPAAQPSLPVLPPGGRQRLQLQFGVFPVNSPVTSLTGHGF